jgi:nucleoside-diphosphate-sugar epimerase
LKKIAISGGTGFLGSHLVERFLSKGYEIVVLKRSTSNTQRIDAIMDQLKVFDVDKQSIEAIFKETEPNIILHTACDYGRKGSSLKDILDTNLLYGVELMEASIAVGVELFINTGSLLPTNVNHYSLSKDQFSQWLKMFSKSLKSVDLRIEHMIGPKDDANKFINWLISQMMDGTQNPIHLTSGIQQRDFIYIDDVVDAFEIMVNKTEGLKGYNSYDVGSGNFVPVKDFIELLTNELELKHSIEIKFRLNFGSIDYRENDVMVPQLDNSELLALGWIVKTNVHDSIKNIVK